MPLSKETVSWRRGVLMESTAYDTFVPKTIYPLKLPVTFGSFPIKNTARPLYDWPKM